MTDLTRDDLYAMDVADPLADLRDRFDLPGGVIYLDGNSLGAMPKAAKALASDVVSRQWGHDLIKSWNSNHWFTLPYRLGDKLARLLGADQGEIVCCDAVGINLYKALALAIKLNPDRRVILMEDDNFPTDVYMAQGLIDQLDGDYQLKLVPGPDLADAIDDKVAVVSITQVNYKTGLMQDMKAVCEKARAAGALTIWDLSHSAGAVPVDLNDAGADIAVGCTYKYLNGGPGSPGYVFVAVRHQNKAQQPLTGWWGHRAPFAFDRHYDAGPGIQQMSTGTQPITSMSLVEPGLDMFLDVDFDLVRDKSVKLCDLFIRLVEERCTGMGFYLNSPRDAQMRGSQVSFNHESGYAITKALISKGVIGDFRAPANMRFGFAPLYVRYSDVWNAVEILHDIMMNDTWRAPEFNKVDAVT